MTPQGPRSAQTTNMHTLTSKAARVSVFRVRVPGRVSSMPSGDFEPVQCCEFLVVDDGDTPT